MTMKNSMKIAAATVFAALSMTGAAQAKEHSAGLLQKEGAGLIGLAKAYGPRPVAHADVEGAFQLVHCRSRYLAMHYAVGDVVTNREMGCVWAENFAVAWQKADWAGRIYVDFTEPSVLGWRFQGSHWTWSVTYRAFHPRDRNPILRVTAKGLNSYMFASFETDQ